MANIVLGNMGLCWEWSGAKDEDSYGIVWQNGKNKKAHRVMYELHHNKSIPAGLCVCHRCDNPPCINPEHLVAATPKENTWDAVDRFRHISTRPLDHPRAKLTANQVRLIRGSKEVGKWAKMFGVNASVIDRVKTRVKYANVPD